MANVSSSNGLEKRPKLRFPGFDGPIKSAHLSQYLVENKERNKNLIYTKSDVLSVSGEYGKGVHLPGRVSQNIML